MRATPQASDRNDDKTAHMDAKNFLSQHKDPDVFLASLVELKAAEFDDMLRKLRNSLQNILIKTETAKANDSLKTIFDPIVLNFLNYFCSDISVECADLRIFYAVRKQLQSLYSALTNPFGTSQKGDGDLVVTTDSQSYGQNLPPPPCP